MGTNFYGRKQISQETQVENQIHLGKKSGGWNFLAQWNGGEYYTNKQEYLDFVKELEIFDEYGNSVEFETFKNIVNSWRGKTHKYMENIFFDNNAELEFGMGKWS